MNDKLDALKAKRDQLELEIASLQKEAKLAALDQIKTLVISNNLTADDVLKLFPKQVHEAKQSKLMLKIPPKYRDPKTGATWSGRGKSPRWMEDQNRDDFLIQDHL